jgi:O-antigen/teichoic acid export membrane protein
MLNPLKKLIQSDNSKVLMGNLSASLFGLITFMILARVLTKGAFGEWAIFVAASGFADLLRTGLIRQAMVRFIALTNDAPRKTQYQIAAVTLHIITIALISFLMYMVLIVFGQSIASPYDLFLKWYPLWMLLSMPHMMDTWFSHALKKFGRMNKIRLFINIGFLLFVSLGFFVEYTIESLILGNMLIQGVLSGVSLIRYPAVFFNLNQTKWVYARHLFKFGKHSLATLTGANLLKSADHMIVGAMMGTEAVAIYAIPLKMMDLVEIPLRGFVMTSFSKLSVFAIKRDTQGFQQHFYQWTGMLTLLFIPLALMILWLPQFFIGVLGGGGFTDSQVLLQVFVVAMLLMPLDKYLGMSIDSINLPKRNAIKVWVMVIVNIVGDYLAIRYFHSLLAVALVTNITLLSGLVAGFSMHPILKFDFFRLLSSGISFGRSYILSMHRPVIDKSLPSAE